MFQPRYTRQFPSSRTSHIPCIFICVAPIISVVLLCTFYLSRSSNYHPSFPSLLQHGNVAYNKEHFVQDILNSEIDGPFNNTSLTTLCSRQDWIEGLVIECVGFGGGVGNIRNVFLNCFRYAIEAGATGLILPQIIKRAEDKIEIHHGKLIPFTYLFDAEYLTESLSTSCPRMHIISNATHIESISPKPIDLVSKSLVPLSRDQFPTCIEPKNWGQNFRQFLKDANAAISSQRPQIIHLDVTIFEWPLSFDEPTFVATFGRILRFRADVRQIVATILYGIRTQYAPDLELVEGIQDNLFYGAHLRTSVDAAAAHWRGYEAQSKDYLSAAAERNLSLIYLACGNSEDITRFNTTAISQNMSVVTKDLILSSSAFTAERKLMEALSWDQRALIDYEVLLRSSIFGATLETSFGWNIAFRRHVVVGNGTWIAVSPDDVADDIGLTFADERSMIFGNKGGSSFFTKTVWP